MENFKPSIDSRLTMSLEDIIIIDINKRYIYKDVYYKVLFPTRFKHPERREWIEALAYEQVSTGLVFVREVKEFIRLFKAL